MKNDKLFHVCKKEFLSDLPEEASAVSWHVTVKRNTREDPVAKDKEPSFDCDLRIQDCNRPIYLDFSLWCVDSDYYNRVKKINTLITALLEFKEAYITAYEMYANEKEEMAKQNQQEYIIGHCYNVVPVGMTTSYHHNVRLIAIDYDDEGEIEYFIVREGNNIPMPLHAEEWKLVED